VKGGGIAEPYLMEASDQFHDLSASLPSEKDSIGQEAGEEKNPRPLKNKTQNNFAQVTVKLIYRTTQFILV